MAEHSQDRRHGASWRAWLLVFNQLATESKSVRDLIEISHCGTKTRRQRSVAVWVLGELRARTAAEPLLGLLQGRDPEISWHAANALCSIGDVRVVPKLLRTASASPYVHAREGAVWALHKIKAPEAVPTLIKAASQDKTPAVRQSATHSLISYPSKRTFEALRSALDDPSASVRFGAIFAISCLANKKGVELAIPELKKLLQDTTVVPNSGRISEEARDAIDAIQRHVAARQEAKTGARPRFRRTAGSNPVIRRSATRNPVTDGT
jgi:HEAT repeat protein